MYAKREAEKRLVGAEDGFVYAIALDGARGKNHWDHLADKGKTDWFINASPTGNAATRSAASISVQRKPTDGRLSTFNLARQS